MPKTKRYAEGTTTSVESSKNELRTILKRYGATKMIDVHDSEQGDAVQFEMRGRWIQFAVPRPDPEAYREYRSPPNRYFTTRRTDEQVAKKTEQEYMRRWRVLLLLVKAKLEAVMDADESGDPVDFDTEFVGYMMLPDGSTVGQNAKEEMDAIYLGASPPSIRGLLRLRKESEE